MTIDTPPLLMGVRDYSHAPWRTEFYPPGLPSEWRFMFYSHRYPGMLLSPRAWGVKRERLSLWESEAPPSFRLVLEVSDRSLDRLLALGPLPRPFVAGCVVRVSRRITSLMTGLEALSRALPVAVDARLSVCDLTASLAEIGVGVCGRPAEGGVPSGPFAVSLIGPGDRALAGRALTELLKVKAPRGRALFFCEPGTAIRSLEEAQWLASLLGERP